MKKIVDKLEKIISMIKKIFSRKKQVELIEKSKQTQKCKRKEFQEFVKCDAINESDIIDKIKIQKERDKLLENFSKNPELIDMLSMEELRQLEKLYEEELNKKNI